LFGKERSYDYYNTEKIKSKSLKKIFLKNGDMNKCIKNFCGTSKFLKKE